MKGFEFKRNYKSGLILIKITQFIPFKLWFAGLCDMS
jgi:hypothetical protein